MKYRTYRNGMKIAYGYSVMALQKMRSLDSLGQAGKSNGGEGVGWLLSLFRAGSKNTMQALTGSI